MTGLVGKRVDIKPRAGLAATSGVVRSVHGEGATASYEVDAVDATGWRQTVYLVRAQFTPRRPS